MGDEIIRRAQGETPTRRRIDRVLAFQMNDTLEVIRLREQIDQMNVLDPISTRQQYHEIPRQCDRIA